MFLIKSIKSGTYQQDACSSPQGGKEEALLSLARVDSFSLCKQNFNESNDLKIKSISAGEMSHGLSAHTVF